MASDIAIRRREPRLVGLDGGQATAAPAPGADARDDDRDTEDLDPNGRDVRTTLHHPDGSSEVRQDGNTSQFMHTVGEIIEYVSRVMTLLPGDVVLTGTPAGVGPMLPGDRVTVEIEGIGALTNPVVDR